MNEYSEGCHNDEVRQMIQKKCLMRLSCTDTLSIE